MSLTPTGGHPDPDLLADLAADALDPRDAGAVEAHVMACAGCAGLLESAEALRGVLRDLPAPGPMPAAVWRRLEGVLAHGAAPAAAPGTVGGSPAPLPEIDEAPTAAWSAFLNADEPPAADQGPGPATSSFGVRDRSGGPRTASRREALTDRRTERRPKLWLGAAAGVLVLLLGAGAVVTVLRGGDSGDAAAALPGATSASVVVSTGTAYTASNLATDVTALVDGGGASATATGSASATASGTSAAEAVGTVADPDQLDSCLAALGENDRSPLVVDLATYEGREAAVIVLSGTTGGYDVWIVARTCTMGADGTLGYKEIPAGGAEATDGATASASTAGTAT